MNYKGHEITVNENGSCEFDGKQFKYVLFAKEYIDDIEQQNEAYCDKDGVWRWNSNDSVPPIDILEKWNLSDETMRKCVETKDAETSEFIAKYRKQMEDYVPSNEEMFEMRAAFGEGATVVNVITGKKIHL